MRRKQNFEMGLKVTQQSYFSLFLLPSFFAFLASFFFSLAGHLVGFILVGRVFRKAFRILGLGERKGRWVMEQDFHGDFQVNVTSRDSGYSVQFFFKAERQNPLKYFLLLQNGRPWIDGRPSENIN